MTSITLLASVTSIEEYMFQYCESLTNIIIPNSVTSIGKSAFSSCRRLTDVTIPNSVTSIGESAFSGCSRLANITIPNSVTSIGKSAFQYCDSLTSITIPNSITSIADYTFCGCDGLASVTIGSGVQNISWRAFCRYHASDYSERSPLAIDKVIWLPNTPPEGYRYVYGKVHYVSNDSYSGYYSRREVYPYLSSMFEVDGIKYVPVNPSERTCDAIDCVYDPSVANIKIDKTVKYKGVEMTVKDTKPYLCCGNKHIKSVTLNYAGETGIIRKYAFSGCSGIQQLVIPNTITGIETACFSGCTDLKSIDLGSGIKELKDSVFYNCSSLSDIEIPGNIGSMGNYVFSRCTSLTKANIADRETELKLGYYVFDNCPLKSVCIGGNINYQSSPFQNNTSLEYVEITDKETEISDKEFYGCTNLKDVTVGDGIETIGNYAFSGCSSLEKFTFGTSLKSIGKEAFSDCTALTRITAKAEVPPTCGTQALDDINKWTCTLCVPEAQMEAYKAADQWKDFFFYDTVEAGVENVDADDAVEVERFNLDGTRLTAPQKGINIVRMSDGTTRKVLVK